jgi:hypothetical protein
MQCSFPKSRSVKQVRSLLERLKITEKVEKNLTEKQINVTKDDDDASMMTGFG